MKGYGPDGPPPLACVALFAIVSTTAGFRAAYDPNGNMVRRVEVSGTQPILFIQEYDPENRLAVVTNTVTGQVTRFVYDGDGNRVLRIGPEGTTVYIGDHFEKQGAVVTKYYYAAGQRMAMRVGGALYFLHSDHLGSATLTTDSSGNRVGEVRYRPYGERRPGYPVGAMVTDRLYTGQQWEQGLGLYDYRARFYDPALGRFLQPDPLVPEPGNPQALNRYAYVYNNPLRYTDPSGHCPWCVVIAKTLLQTAVDVGIDYLIARATGTEFRLVPSLAVNAAVNVTTLGVGSTVAKLRHLGKLALLARHADEATEAAQALTQAARHADGPPRRCGQPNAYPRRGLAWSGSAVLDGKASPISWRRSAMRSDRWVTSRKPSEGGGSQPWDGRGISRRQKSWAAFGCWMIPTGRSSATSNG
jgi:RHS repeat-associated protein